jgi:four helix bundle protein
METKNFEFQKWAVYQESIEFVRESSQLCGKLPKDGNRSIVDQLRRASQSVPLNIAEGSARYTRPDKVNFFRVARGSVFECVAILDVLGVLARVLEGDLDRLYERLALIGKMLSGFIRYIENETPEKAH